MAQQLWQQKYTTAGTAQDALDVFVHDIGMGRIISQSVYQSQKDEQWVAMCRYSGDLK